MKTRIHFPITSIDSLKRYAKQVQKFDGYDSIAAAGEGLAEHLGLESWHKAVETVKNGTPILGPAGCSSGAIARTSGARAITQDVNGVPPAPRLSLNELFYQYEKLAFKEFVAKVASALGASTSPLARTPGDRDRLIDGFLTVTLTVPVPGTTRTIELFCDVNNNDHFRHPTRHKTRLDRADYREAGLMADFGPFFHVWADGDWEAGTVHSHAIFEAAPPEDIAERLAKHVVRDIKAREATTAT